MIPLIECYTDTNYEILEDVQGKPLRVGGEMQLAEVRNQNGRVYPLALWQRVLESPKTTSRLKERRMVGELDHPSAGKTTVRNISHVVTELRLQDSKRFPGKQAVYGVYECIPTPDGKILETLHRNHIGVAVSSRGDGDVEDRGGESYVIPESYSLDTFDAVMDPSVNVSVKVLESMAGANNSTVCTLKKALGSQATENLVKAIYGIVESGNFSRSDAVYYKSILESVESDDSETYLLATDALKELKEHLEVIKVMVPKNQTGLDAPSSGITEQQVQSLNEQIQALQVRCESAEKRAVAGEKVVNELLIQSRAFKMRAESLQAQVAELSPLRARYESAKVVLSKLRESVITLENESKFRMAAEKLLGALLTKIDEAKRSSYVDRLLDRSRMSEEDRKTLRPILLECDSKSKVNKLMEAVSKSKTLNEDRRLPPLNRDGSRSGRIPQSSPLLEDDNNRTTESTDELKDHPLREDIEFSRRLVKGMHEPTTVA